MTHDIKPRNPELSSVYRWDVLARGLNNPVALLLISTLIGWALGLLSYLLGVAFFNVNITVITNERALPLELTLGYLAQANYGLWYALPFFGPALLVFVSFSLKTLRDSSPLTDTHGIFTDNDIRLIAAIGWIVLIAFVLKDVLSELDAFRTLGLGWVQAPILEKIGTQIAQTGRSIDLTALGKRFDHFLLLDSEQEKVTGYLYHWNIRRVLLDRVDPSFRVSSFRFFILFVGLTKSWMGVWEAAVVYLGFVICLWVFRVFRLLRPETMAQSSRDASDLSWFFRPACYVFLTSIWVQVFYCLRFYANALKGSYGYWDKYSSLLTLAPGATIAVMGLLIIGRIYSFQGSIRKIHVPKIVIGLATVWITTLSIVGRLVLGYLDPQLPAILALSLSPFQKLLSMLKA